jgi:hypothetical protein
MNFFGRKKQAAPVKRASPSQPNVSTALASITSMKTTCTNLEKRQAFLVTKADAELKEAAMRKKRGDINGAKLHLKRKLMYDKQVGTLAAQHMNLEQQILSLENLSVSADVVSVMEKGQAVMQNLAKKNDPDKVDEMMADIQDNLAAADEVSNILGQQLDTTDDADLMAELDELDELDDVGESTQEQDDLDLLAELGELTPGTKVSKPTKKKTSTKKPVADPFASVPSVPSGKIKQAVDEDEAELAKLMATME